MSRAGHLYLLQRGDLGAGAVKVGRSNCPRRRIREYPPGSWFVEVTPEMRDCVSAERVVIRWFRARFPLLDGRECFAAPLGAAVAEFRRACESLAAPEEAAPADPAEPMDWC